MVVIQAEQVERTGCNMVLTRKQSAQDEQTKIKKGALRAPKIKQEDIYIFIYLSLRLLS